MSEDRKLLEDAARAAGLDVEFMPLSGANLMSGPRAGLWRPLEDDGDALRLAVRLRIEVEPWIHGDSAFARTAVGEVLIDEPHSGDPERATRRAIVRAAAAMAPTPAEREA